MTTVNVTAGKPSELSFKLSKFSNLPAGLITFKVTNMGLGFHNFKICTSPVLTTAKNTCVGKATPLLKHGQSATLVVKLSKNGKYEFLCAVPGHAAAGMKGLIGIGVTVAGGKPTPVATTTPTPTPTPTTTTTASTPPPATTTTTPAGGGGGGGATSPECPPGTTIAQAAAGNGGDADIDDAGGPSDADGCV